MRSLVFSADVGKQRTLTAIYAASLTTRGCHSNLSKAQLLSNLEPFRPKFYSNLKNWRVFSEFGKVTIVYGGIGLAPMYI